MSGCMEIGMFKFVSEKWMKLICELAYEGQS